MGDAAHWDERYRSVGTTLLSWYEERPTVSLELLEALGVTAVDSLIDVGGGASVLVDHLVAAGHRDLTVLDLSSVALDAARSRLGAAAPVEWIEADLTTWEPRRQWDVWHDRAVLHFLTAEADRRRYVETLRRAIRPGGAVVIGTFAEDGPTECSALPVRRHRTAELVALLDPAEVVEARRHVHETPSGALQPFSWVAARLG